MLSLLVGATAAAGVTKPDGKKPARPKPTHVVVADTTVDLGGGLKAQVRAGTAVTGKLAAVPKGKVKVTLASGVDLAGTIDGATLGWRVDVESELRAPDGGPLGRAPAGLLVRPIVGKAKAGWVAVETVTGFAVKGQLPREALTSGPREFVLSGDWQYVAQLPAELRVEPSAKATIRAKVPVGTHLELIEEKEGFARMRTRDGAELEGWTVVQNVRPREDADRTPIEDDLVKPTHEVLADAPIFAGPDRKKKLGVLRGGVLVEVVALDKKARDQKKDPAVKVITPGLVTVEAWVNPGDLRKLEDSVFRE
jgi:hypothetical protein